MRNIMLSFLSPIRANKEGVIKAPYPDLYEDGLGDTHSTNESGLRYVLKEIREGQTGRLDYYICFVSNTVDTKKPLCCDCTHLEYFKQRTAEVLDEYYDTFDIEDFIIEIPFDEKSKEDMSLRYVLAIVNEVKQLKETDDEKKVTVYLDLTGGRRDANMLLLMISRMLEYDEDIVIKEVVYSNFIQEDNYSYGQVETISSSYRLLEFVAGTAEFVNFGSMKSLNNYFANVKIDEQEQSLKRLLAAMNDFTKKIMLCRYGEFVRTIDELKFAIEQFEDMYLSMTKEKRNGVYELLYKFLGNIKKKYRLLFSAQDDVERRDLNIIKWCYKNNYVQQAMTLITERLPGIFLSDDQGILRIPESEKERFRERYKEYKSKHKDNKLMFPEWLFFQEKQADIIEERKKKDYTKIQSKFHRMLQNLENSNEFDKEMSFLLKQKEAYNGENFLNFDEVIANMREYKEFYDKSDKKHPPSTDEKYNSIHIHKTMLSTAYYLKVNIDRFWKRYTSKKRTEDEIFKMVGGVLLDKSIFEDKGYPGNFGSIKNMLVYEKLFTEYDLETVLSLVHLYFEIKEERNAVNHAHNKVEKISLDDLLRKIELLIEGVERLKYGEIVE